MDTIGQTFIEKHTLAQEEFNRFAKLSGDDNPIHVDPEFSARTRFGKTVAHGMFLYSLICGVLAECFPGASQVSQDLMFPAPSFVGEEIAISLRVLEVNADTLRVETIVTRPNDEIGCQGETTLRLTDQRMTDLVWLETHDQIATLTLNRPKRHNSLVPEFLRELLNALERVSQQDELRALVLQADGRSFSTGGDVQAFYEHRDSIEAYASEIVGLLNQVVVAMVRLPMPVVAAVHGIVTGGSIGLVLASDIVLVAPDASFTPFYSVVGFSPDGGWTAMLPAVIGQKHASETLMLNQTITAEQAVQWGMANRVVAADHIRDQAHAVAESIAQKKRESIQRTKRLLWKDTDVLAARLEEERARFCEQIVTAEALKGMEAFLSSDGRNQVSGKAR